MRKMIGLLMAAAVLAAGTANAQTLRPGTPSILRWTLEQQTEWYPAIETVYGPRPSSAATPCEPLAQGRALARGPDLQPRPTRAGRSTTT